MGLYTAMYVIGSILEAREQARLDRAEQEWRSLLDQYPMLKELQRHQLENLIDSFFDAAPGSHIRVIRSALAGDREMAAGLDDPPGMLTAYREVESVLSKMFPKDEIVKRWFMLYFSLMFACLSGGNDEVYELEGAVRALTPQSIAGDAVFTQLALVALGTLQELGYEVG